MVGDRSLSGVLQSVYEDVVAEDQLMDVSARLPLGVVAVPDSLVDAAESGQGVGAGADGACRSRENHPDPAR